MTYDRQITDSEIMQKCKNDIQTTKSESIQNDIRDIRDISVTVDNKR